MLYAVRSHSDGLLLVAEVQRRGHDRHDAEPQHARPIFFSVITLVVIYGPGCGYKDMCALFNAYTSWRAIQVEDDRREGAAGDEHDGGEHRARATPSREDVRERR